MPGYSKRTVSAAPLRERSIPTRSSFNGGSSPLFSVTRVNGVWVRLSETTLERPDALAIALPKGITTLYASLSKASFNVPSSMALNVAAYPASSAAARIKSTPMPVISPVSASR